jgi:hypothetical protein
MRNTFSRYNLATPLQTFPEEITLTRVELQAELSAAAKDDLQAIQQFFYSGDISLNIVQPDFHTSIQQGGHHTLHHFLRICHRVGMAHQNSCRGVDTRRRHYRQDFS